MSVAQERADTLYRGVMLTLVASFGIILLLANLAQQFVVVRRIKRLARIADQVSKGDVDAVTPASAGSDEISSLERAFERMRVSLALAMKSLRDAD
jgi:protein-histidine pros-kinase